MEERSYLCIDLKSFYASVECVERKLDPLTTNLVVADASRTEKTICLAITPPMKALGISSRSRVFQIPKGVKYIMATPRMKLYLNYSGRVYAVYLRYVSKEDIHVYSVDEAFLDVTDYLALYGLSARELGMKILADIKRSTRLIATCGIGTNLYLAKIALDITAKHSKDFIGELDEASYRRELWNHKPLTSFWRIGRGTARRLESIGVTTMKGLTEVDEDVIYNLFGIDAELLIDHAYGRESTQMSDIKKYKSGTHSISNGQVLPRGYEKEECRLLVKEMSDLLCLDLVDKQLVTSNIFLGLSYSKESAEKSTHGSVTMTVTTNSNRTIMSYIMNLFDKIIVPHAKVHRIGISFNNVVDEAFEQYDLFVNPSEMERDRRLQKAALEIKEKFGKNAILKGMNLMEGGRTIERNQQIGGHKSGDKEM